MTKSHLPADPMFATAIATPSDGDTTADPQSETDPALAPIGDEPSDPPAAVDSDGEGTDDDETSTDGIVAAVRGFIEERPLVSIAIAGTAGLGAFVLFQSVFLRPRHRRYRK